MSDYTPQSPVEHHDSLVIDDAVIEKITAVVARNTEGILDMKGSLMSGFASSIGATAKASKGITASVDGAAASIEIKAILEYGASAPAIFERIKTVVREQVKAMTGLEVRDINFRVVNIMTRDEFERDSKKAAAQQAQS
ncbi:MAG: Asp23/Gls24 family envelope stress response protein [Peptococcaceae bacterium]|nr:Asp23/Gls24 family envelope stress response protein [Peptococcaceae bacterium]